MKIASILISFFVIGFFATDLKDIREAYKEAAHDQSKVNGFYDMLSDINRESDPTWVAYKGASVALKAKYAKTIKEKKAGFQEGVGYIEHAIESAPKTLEIRFIRLGIQENTPKVLKYKGNIAEDKQFLLDHFSDIASNNLKNHVKNFILSSSVFTDAEKERISQQ